MPSPPPQFPHRHYDFTFQEDSVADGGAKAGSPASSLSRSRSILREPDAKHCWVLVVDSARIGDAEYSGECRRVLTHALSPASGSGVGADAPVVVMANKQDLSEAHAPASVATALHIRSLRGRHWHVQGSSVQSGDGVFEMADWIVSVFDNVSAVPRKPGVDGAACESAPARASAGAPVFDVGAPAATASAARQARCDEEMRRQDAELERVHESVRHLGPSVNRTSMAAEIATQDSLLDSCLETVSETLPHRWSDDSAAPMAPPPPPPPGPSSRYTGGGADSGAPYTGMYTPPAGLAGAGDANPFHDDGTDTAAPGASPAAAVSTYDALVDALNRRNRVSDGCVAPTDDRGAAVGTTCVASTCSTEESALPPPASDIRPKDVLPEEAEVAVPIGERWAEFHFATESQTVVEALERVRGAVMAHRDYYGADRPLPYQLTREVIAKQALMKKHMNPDELWTPLVAAALRATLTAAGE